MIAPNNARERAAMIDEDGECTMCADGAWPEDAISCPICDAEIPDEDAEDEE